MISYDDGMTFGALPHVARAAAMEASVYADGCACVCVCACVRVDVSMSVGNVHASILNGVHVFVWIFVARPPHVVRRVVRVHDDVAADVGV